MELSKKEFGAEMLSDEELDAVTGGTSEKEPYVVCCLACGENLGSVTSGREEISLLDAHMKVCTKIPKKKHL